MNGDSKSSFWTGLFAGMAFTFALCTISLAIILTLVIKSQGGYLGNPQAPAQHEPAPAGPLKPVPAVDEGLYPSLGPANAPVTITEFADFHCHFCKVAVPTIKQVLKNYPTQIRYIFRHYPLSQNPGQGSFLTHEASLCAKEQEKFWPFFDAVYALAKSPEAADLDNIATQIGLNMNKFKDCLKSGRNQKFLLAEGEAGRQKGAAGTPTFFINNQIIRGAEDYNSFSKMIDGILKDGDNYKPEAAAPSAPPAVPAVVKFDDLDGRPSVGPKNAVITLVEFSDFHCPFCKRVEPTIDQLMKSYDGKIRKVWRHFPLPMHQGSAHTHEASECANEQGKFWEYHAKLIETQGSTRDDAALIGIAESLKLNKKKFESCLTGGKYKDLIQKEIAKGNQAGVNGTPAVFVNGELVSGAQPYENFDRLVKKALSK